jgi:hypothetical protein
MYWLQDFESARALARLWSGSPHPTRDDRARQGDPDELTLPVAADPLIDPPATDDGAAGRNGDALVTPCQAPELFERE